MPFDYYNNLTPKQRRTYRESNRIAHVELGDPMQLQGAVTTLRDALSAGDRRRVAAVLGAAPLAALWGPSPIPRAGGRCLDVIRLLRITTGSPAVEATSVRCQWRTCTATFSRVAAI